MMTFLRTLATRLDVGQAPYLATLRRVPDDIIREIAPLPIDPQHPQLCIVGRLRTAAEQRHLCEKFYPYVEWPTTTAVAEAFGGSTAEWHRLFIEITHTDDRKRIMRAYHTRIAEAA